MLNPELSINAARDTLLVLALTLPFIAMIVAFVLGGRRAQTVATLSFLMGIVLSGNLAWQLLESGQSLHYLLGAWAPPLGIKLMLDGFSAVMLLTSSVILFAVAIFARADFITPREVEEARAPVMFWTLLLGVWGALNLIFLASDLFTLYVALELVTFAGVPLVCLDGKSSTLQAALRYLLFALLGSVLYLLGAVLLYGAYGTLDIGLLAKAVQPEAITYAAAALMTVGLLAKTALFPLHLWLPPAHAGAPAAASAVLSALVVKGSFFLLLRLWLDVMPTLIPLSAAELLAGFGALAIIVGNLVALRQTRLKLLIAYSTVAQIGYLFLMFPLFFGLAKLNLATDTATTGGMLQVVSHAIAKAAMFMAAGLIYCTLGHDRIADLRGVGRQLPVTMLAFILAGASLIGLPPTGGFLAKWFLLSSALSTGQWWWAAVMLIGGLLTCCYVFAVMVRAMQIVDEPITPQQTVPRYREVIVLALAITAFVLGLAAFLPVDLIQIGRPSTVLLGHV